MMTKEEIELLLKENYNLRQKLKHYNENIKYGSKGKTMNEWQIDTIQNSITPLNLHWLRRMNKADLMIIILNREMLLRNKIEEFNKSIKHNDRHIFTSQQNEIKSLTALLIDKSPLFAKVEYLKDEVKRHRERADRYSAKLHMLKIKHNLYTAEKKKVK